MPFPPLPDPPTRAERLAGLLKGVPIASVLSSTLLSLNVTQTASLLMLPVSRRTFRRYNRWAANTWWGLCVTIGERINGVRVEYSGDEVPQNEDAIVIANHQQMADITYLMFLARDSRTLGDMKWFVKDPIKYVPGIGWGMTFLDCVFVKRNWAADRASIDRTFSKLNRDRVPVWLLSFPEGTRITDDKYASGCAYAQERSMKPFDHLLVPRTKGFVASVQGLRNHVKAVYDVTIGYPEGVPTLWQYVKGYSARAKIHVRRHPIESLPESKEQLAAWLMDRFRDKDERLERFRTSGELADAPEPKRQRSAPDKRTNGQSAPSFAL